MIRLDALTLKQLRALQAVVAERSLAGAARVLNQTTPAIHSQIKNLETAVGHPVLQKAGDEGGFVPTLQGAEVLAAAERIEAILSQAARRMAALQAGRSGHVALGVVSTAKYFAPGLVRRLMEACPEIEVELRVGNRETVIDWLARGAVDLAVMGRPPREPQVAARPVGPHPHGIVLPPGHALAGADGFDPARLMQETFISREAGSGTRILMERFLDRLAEGLPLRMIQMDSNETIKQAVIAGLGIAFLSLHTVGEELATGRLVLLRGPGLPAMRHWYLVTPQLHPATPAATRIAAAIDAMNGAFLPAASAISG